MIIWQTASTADTTAAQTLSQLPHFGVDGEDNHMAILVQYSVRESRYEVGFRE